MPDLNVLVLAAPNAPQLAMLQSLPDGIRVIAGNRIEDLEQDAPHADVILNWSARRTLLESVWEKAQRTRWVHSRSAGLDHVLFPALVQSPVPVTNSRGVFSEPLGEFVMGAILFFAKDFRRMLRSQGAGIWDPFDVIEIRRQTLGIVGYGDIGRSVARRARTFDMNVVATRRRPQLSSNDPLVDEVLPLERRCELMARSDYVAVALPLTPETTHLIGEPELLSMKNTGVVINVGRGPVIHEPSLIRVLQEKRIRGAALDVFDQEPLPPGHPFYGLENVLLSPHCADNTSEWLNDAMRFFMKNLERFRNGEPLLNVVDKQKGY